jgi:hypothetical protein
MAKNQETPATHFWERLPDQSIHNPTLKKAWKEICLNAFAQNASRGEISDGLDFEIEILNILILDILTPTLQENIGSYLSKKLSNDDVISFLENPENIIILDFNDPLDKEYYDYFFTIRLINRPLKRVYDFLTYHLKNTFKSDQSRFRNFLDYAILKDNGNLLNDDQRSIISNYFKDPGHQPEYSGPTARESAIILFLNVESKQESESKPKRAWLERHAIKLNIGVSSFSKKFFDVQKDFKNCNSVLIQEIKSVYPFLNQEAKKVADSQIQRISQSALQPKKLKRF